MIKLLALLLTTLLGLQVQAQTLKVTKIKGNRAIVEVIDGKVTNGQIVRGGSRGSSDDLGLPGESKGGDRTGPRTHFVGGSGSFATAKAAGSSSSTTSISANAEYGWNPGDQMEYGLILSFGSVSGGSGGSTTSFAGGGRFDWDFAANKAPLDSLFSAGVIGTFGTASAGGGSSVSQITVFPMLSWKYFILNTPTCVRVDGGLKIVQSSGSGGSNTSTTDTNPAVNIGLFTYFQ